MFKNYLKIAVRNLRKQKGYTIINISGLAIGIACCLFILLYVQYELSYDRFHENADQIYKAISEITLFGKTDKGDTVPVPFAPALLDESPEVVSAVRIHDFSGPKKVLINYKGKRFEEDRFFLADPSIFKVFTFAFNKGEPKTALNEPHSIVITEEIAHKYFGDKDPVGKVITLNNTNDFKITGILKNIPQNSHINFNFLAPLACANDLYENNLELPAHGTRFNSWRNYNCHTYLLLQKDYDPTEVERKIPLTLNKYSTGDMHSRPHSNDILKIYLQPLTEIHLYSDFHSGLEPSGDIKYIYIFSTIAFLILLIACINFMNLSTAKFTNRAKEVGFRKVVGANRAQLIKQFLGESVFMSFIALILAIVIIELLLPVFNSIISREIVINYYNNWLFILGLIGITLFVGLVAGSYPAFFLSRFQPVNILKGMLQSGLKKSNFRNSLVVLQFTISIFLIVGVTVIYSQLEFMKNVKLGFNKERVVVLPIKDKSIRQKYESVKMTLTQNPNVIAATASSELPSDIRNRLINIKWEGGEALKPTSMRIVRVDYDFIKMFELELTAGREFSREISTDAANAFILNESALEKTGWASPIGKRFSRGHIIGVVKDFHFSSLHQKIEPLLLTISPRWFNYISVKISTDDILNTMDFLKKTWQGFHPNQAFEYFFLDDYFDKLYREEQRLGDIFGYFSVLAIFIACLGLFGLASFTTELRTKEIGIRKVMGASVSNVIRMLTREFTKLVIFANIIALPLAYFAAHNWLQKFAYRVNVNLFVFIVAGGLALFVALFTVGFQALKAAIANPVDSLRYE